jgi:hypothetical protein
LGVKFAGFQVLPLVPAFLFLDGLKIIEKMNELIKLQKEYIEFLGRCYNDAILIATLHHRGASEENIKKGAELRNKIKVCENKIIHENINIQWEYRLEIIFDKISLTQLNKYGKEGWELTFIKPSLNEENKRELEIIFKRKLFD